MGSAAWWRGLLERPYPGIFSPPPPYPRKWGAYRSTLCIPHEVSLREPRSDPGQEEGAGLRRWFSFSIPVMFAVYAQASVSLALCTPNPRWLEVSFWPVWLCLSYLVFTWWLFWKAKALGPRRWSPLIF